MPNRDLTPVTHPNCALELKGHAMIEAGNLVISSADRTEWAAGTQVDAVHDLTVTHEVSHRSASLRIKEVAEAEEREMFVQKHNMNGVLGHDSEPVRLYWARDNLG